MSLRADYLTPLDPTRSPMTFDLNVTGNELRYDVRRYSAVTVQAVKQTTWATAVLTIYRSADGVTPFALEIADTLGPGSDISATLDTSGFPYLIVRLTTLEGSQVFANITALGKASE